MRNKLCLIFDTPSLYREAIHKKIDDNYECDWFFGDNDYQVKKYNISILKKVSILHVCKPFFKNNIYLTKGMIPLLFSKNYNSFFLVGEPRNVTIWIFALLKKWLFPNKKLYFWCHGWYGKETWGESMIKKAVYGCADCIFTYGEYAKKLMVDIGFDKEKIHPIHNSLDYMTQLSLRQQMTSQDIYSKHFGNNYPVLLFIGRLTEIKRLDLLLEAMSMLRDKGELYNLILVGDGTVKEQLVQLTKQKKLVYCVWFYGACYNESQNAKLVYNADLCVSPGNVGLTAMHSMMFGTPVISHNCLKLQMPEVEAIKPDVTGNFFEYGNAKNLGDTISRWFKNHGKERDKIRIKCFQEIDNYWNPEYQFSILKQYI